MTIIYLSRAILFECVFFCISTSLAGAAEVQIAQSQNCTNSGSNSYCIQQNGDMCQYLLGYESDYTKTFQSAEMGGGYNQDRFCEDTLGQLAATNPQGKFDVISHSESKRNHCAPFNCPQYTYYCQVHVRANPKTAWRRCE